MSRLKALSLFSLLLSLSAVTVLGQSNGEVRLAVNGLATGSYTSGRVQVYYKGQWSNICNTGFGSYEANVICHQLGYDSADNHSFASVDSYGIDDHPTLLANVSCANNNLHIFQCSYEETFNCDDLNDVSVACSSTPVWTDPHQEHLRIIPSRYPSMGRLEIYLSGDWDTLCDNGFGEGEANTACRQLGYTYALDYNHISDMEGTGGRTTQYTCCSSSTDCIESCYCQDDDDTVDTTKRRKRIDLICTHDDDVTIECDFDEKEKEDAGTRDECDFTARDRVVAIVAGTIAGIIGLIIAVGIGIFVVKTFCLS
ncbi:PREDICTED: neurotrypsin-like isoform X1 [Amphimedon queenslandica]|uniref:SRCR domain-containing protein n=1 Tax=Amphimedon queenslandica TaxID=400682 RepID=A0AAN0I8P8_AMPQE|nr:PREDICTED: neurotrypsin-like isoform X1 [Amphimedon queenslandica]|eukprot:XP_003382607.1 PREDICTED: neurotrypsin-like isoform X1 [Amphimedon queenslandica]